MRSKEIEPGREYWIFDEGIFTKITTIKRTMFTTDTWLCTACNDTLLMVAGDAFLQVADSPPPKSLYSRHPEVDSPAAR